MLELLKIQKLKVRQEVTNEAFPDQEIVSEGSEDDLNFQVMDELLEELEDLRRGLHGIVPGIRRRAGW